MVSPKVEMKNEFAKKSVWLTGASSGIGAALAVQLDLAGAHLILSSRRPEVLEKLKNRLEHPYHHRVVALDLEDPESLAKIVNDTLGESGTCDLLINNGGISQRALAADTELAVDRRLMTINYLGTVAMTKAVLPRMLESGGGIIASVSSTAGKVGSQLRSGYSGSKHAVVGFMDCLRAEQKSNNIQITVACPGWVKTNISYNALNGSGDPENKMDATIANGISAEQCAKEILAAIASGKAEVIIGKGISKWAPTIRRISATLYRHLIAANTYR